MSRLRPSMELVRTSDATHVIFGFTVSIFDLRQPLRSSCNMFNVQGAKPGEAGMRAGVFVPDDSLTLYNQTKPFDVPAGCYPDLALSPPCELREGPKGRGIWVKPVLAKEHIPRRGKWLLLLMCVIDIRWLCIGAIMMRPVPHVAALSTRYLGNHCSACHEEEKKGQPLKRCQKCRTILYCDQVRYLQLVEFVFVTCYLFGVLDLPKVRLVTSQVRVPCVGCTRRTSCRQS
jgi:hypothetical protein